MSIRDKFVNIRMNSDEIKQLDEIMLFIDGLLKELKLKYPKQRLESYGLTRGKFIRSMINEVHRVGYINEDMWFNLCCRILGVDNITAQRV